MTQIQSTTKAALGQMLGCKQRRQQKGGLVGQINPEGQKLIMYNLKQGKTDVYGILKKSLMLQASC